MPSMGLIAQLEQEAHNDIAAMDCLPDKEAELTLEDVRQWYFETEKLIRVLANVLPSTMGQPINQLRYAGHHVLKAVTSEDSEETQRANIVEAWKHCKRACYDAIDLYAFHMEAAYREKIAVLPNHEHAGQLADKLFEHLQHLQKSRFEQATRAAYYAAVQSQLLDGLRLIGEINQALCTSGITAELVNDRLALAAHNKQLRGQIKILEEQSSRRIDLWMLAITFAIVFATMTGLLFQSSGTNLLAEKAKQAAIESSVLQAPTNTADSEPATVISSPKIDEAPTE